MKLFEVIDTGRTGSISVEHIIVFLMDLTMRYINA